MNQGVTDDLGKIEFKATLDLDKTYECQSEYRWRNSY